LADHYETLSQAQLVNLLRKRDGEKKLGLVWERDEIEADAAIDANFIACTLDPALSDGAAPWRNLVVEGDNYDALRWLRMTYAHRVKCIYIDPPYNTGNRDWVYNDHYIDPNDRYRHSTWLEFLYRRLELARDLLANDGVILVSINDENRAKLELLMDEALPGMRLGTFVWRTRQGSNADQGSFLSPDHEHVLAYGRDGFRFSGNDKSYEMYGNADNDPNGDWRKSDLTLGFDYVERPNLYYPLQDPNTEIWYACNPNGVWRYASRDRLKPGQRVQTRTMEEWVERGQILFPDQQRVETWATMEDLLAAIRSGNVPMSGRAPMLREDLPNLEFWIGKPVGFGVPAFKRYKKDLRNATQPLSSWITPRSEESTIDEGANALVSGTNDEGAKVIKEVFGEKAFNYAKPVSLIRELVRQSTSYDDLVVDFFAGSATTAQAVMEVNAGDEGSRRFIMVSSTEATETEPDKNICRDVTAERIRRLNAAKAGKYSNLSAEFAYLRTREIDFDALNLDLAPAEVWTALEAMHGLPLTRYDEALAWNEHAAEGITLILADRTDDALFDRLRKLAEARVNAFVYSWAPGQLKTALGTIDFEIRPVRETLVKRFQQ
jgi:adenine-specific DNA-methyltransferase